jgi:hypothetical protein
MRGVEGVPQARKAVALATLATRDLLVLVASVLNQSSTASAPLTAKVEKPAVSVLTRRSWRFSASLPSEPLCKLLTNCAKYSNLYILQINKYSYPAEP